MAYPTLETLLLNLGAILIGISKAGFGGGTGVIVTPMLALALPPKRVIGLMLPLLLATDIFSLGPYWRRWDNRNLVALLPGAVVGILIGGHILSLLPEAYLKTVIGLIACVFAVLQALKDRFTPSGPAFQARLWHGFPTGLGVGIASTLAHIGGLLTTMYLLPQRLSNRTFVGTTTAIYFLINLIKLGPYLRLGLLDRSVLLQDLYLLPAVLSGTLTGVYLNRRVSSVTFSRIVLVFALITGVKLLME